MTIIPINAENPQPEHVKPAVPLPEKVVADIADVSISLVRKIRSGKRNAETPAGTKVNTAYEIWDERSNLLIQEIKDKVRFSDDK